jgi:hypothetical protein
MFVPFDTSSTMIKYRDSNTGTFHNKIEHVNTMLEGNSSG